MITRSLNLALVNAALVTLDTNFPHIYLGRVGYWGELAVEQITADSKMRHVV